MTCRVQLSQLMSGRVMSIDCGWSNGASWGKTPSASTGNTGGLMIGTVPQSVLLGVTIGSAGSSEMSFIARAMR